MVLVHFVNEVAGEPVCGLPERANWLWSAYPHDVTCAGCWPLIAKHRVRKAPEEAGAAS